MKKSNKQKKIIMLLTTIMIIIILSITTNATQIKTNKITGIYLYGQEQYGDTSHWWSITYTNYDNYIITQSIPYSNIAQWYILEFDNITVQNIKIDFKMKLIDLPTFCSKSTQAQTMNFSGTVIQLKSEIITENEDNEKYIRYYTETEEIQNKTIGRINLYTNLNILSSRIKIYDFELVINDEVYEISKELLQSGKEAKDAVSDYESIIDDIKPEDTEIEEVVQPAQDIIINIENHPDIEGKQQYGWFTTNIYGLFPYILIIPMCCSFMLLSFILFGKAR